MRPPLHLDHASLRVPRLGPALERLEARCGLRGTRTPQAPDWHSRVYLDRSYLEVSARPGEAPASGWTMPLFFLRYERLPELLEHLRAAGFAPKLSEHAGVDGTWQDVSVSAPEGVPAPILVRRTHPPELAADWPPPGGPEALDAVCLQVAAWAPALDFYRRLLGVELVPGEEVEVPLASGRLLLRLGAPGVTGVVLSVPSLARAEEWVDPAETFGWRLGFRKR